MGNMLIDLQIASENIDGLPTLEQIEQWATAAVQPESDLSRQRSPDECPVVSL